MRPLLRSSLTVVCAAVASLATGCERDNVALLKEADKLSSQAKPNYVQAQKVLDEILDRTAGDLTPLALNTRKMALAMRGQNFRNMGLLNAAETDFRNLLTQIDPEDSFSLSFLATLLVERKDLKPDENGKNDLDYATEFAERALKINSDDWAASVAAGLSRLSRGQYRRGRVTDDILINSSGGNLDELRAKIMIATGLPSEDSRCVALARELERRLELRSTDVRSSVAEGVSAARSDTLAGLDFLRKALSTASSDVTVDAAQALLMALYELDQQAEAIVLSRVALRIPNFRSHPYIVDTVSKIFFKAALYEECSACVIDYVVKTPFPVGLATKRRAILAAGKTKNTELIGRAVSTFRKKLGRDSASSTFGRVLDYYEALVVLLKGGKPEDVAKLMSGVTAKLDPDLADIIPEAALYGATAHKALGSTQAREMVEIGLAADPDNVALLKMRAQIELEGSVDPLRAGNDIRRVIVQRPREVEEFFGLLKLAAEKFISKTGRSMSTIEEESATQGKKIPSGFENGWIYYVFARDYFDAGRYSEAGNCALEALSRDSEFKPAYIILGLSRAKLNDTKEARQAFERAIDCIPDDPRVCQAVAQTGLAPPAISLHLIASRADVEGRLVVAESMLERGDLDSASKILAPLASQDDAPDSARILAARLLVTRDDPAFEKLLAKVKAGSVYEVLAEQVRLEAALKRGNKVAVKEQTEKLKSHLTELQVDRLAKAIRVARLQGNSGGVEPAARLLVEATPLSKRREALDLLGQALLDSGNLDGAIEVFDRLIGLAMSPEYCVWLGIVLDKKGDRAGVQEALNLIRREWGGNPLYYQRAILAVLAGMDPMPEELNSIRVGMDDPFSVVAAAAMFVVRSGRLPTPEELPRLTPWIQAAIDFVGTSRERAELILRTALCLRTPGGAIAGLDELRSVSSVEGSAPFVKYLWGEAYAAVPERAADVLPLFIECVKGLPDMDVAWSRSLDLTLSQGLILESNALARAWAQARPNNPNASLAAKLAGCRERLLQPDLAPAAERELTELAIQIPRNFEISLALLDARVQTNRVQDAVAIAKILVKLAEELPLQARRATGPICAMFQKYLKDTLPEARIVGRMLALQAPHDWRPVELLVACDLQEERYTDAADQALDFLRKPDQLRKLTDKEVSSFMSILLKTNPKEAGEIAQMSLGAVPGDLARWRTFSTTFEALNEDAHALRFLQPFVSIEPSGALRGMLAELLAKPGNDPVGALTIVSESQAIRDSGRGTVTSEHVAAARALSLLGKSDEAVKVLEEALTDADGKPVNLENRNAWLALAFSYATRFKPGDTVKGATILRRIGDSMGPESAARFHSMARLLLGLGKNMGPQHLMATINAETSPASRPDSGPASRPESRQAESAPAHK